jgi:hypothetical protein
MAAQLQGLWAALWIKLEDWGMSNNAACAACPAGTRGTPLPPPRHASLFYDILLRHVFCCGPLFIM